MSECVDVCILKEHHDDHDDHDHHDTRTTTTTKETPGDHHKNAVLADFSSIREQPVLTGGILGTNQKYAPHPQPEAGPRTDPAEITARADQICAAFWSVLARTKSEQISQFFTHASPHIRTPLLFCYHTFYPRVFLASEPMTGPSPKPSWTWQGRWTPTPQNRTRISCVFPRPEPFSPKIWGASSLASVLHGGGLLHRLRRGLSKFFARGNSGRPSPTPHKQCSLFTWSTRSVYPLFCDSSAGIEQLQKNSFAVKSMRGDLHESQIKPRCAGDMVRLLVSYPLDRDYGMYYA